MPHGKTRRSLDLINTCRAILAEIQPATVRAVCYQLFVRKQIDAMSKANTNRVSRQLVFAREEGIIPWDWIVDETRDLERRPSWANPEQYIRVVQRSYRRDRWAQQPRRVEIWSEKGTVRGTVAPILDEYGLGFRVMHGYGSATILHDVAEGSIVDRQPLTVLYVGDWDPSGLHMSEVDLPRRLTAYGGAVDLRRIALTIEDTADASLPSFDADDKQRDPRWAWFVDHYGDRCWELDALSPVVLRERVEDAVQAYIDATAWERCAAVEAAERDSLRDILGKWRAASA
jgi:hypothetical protein